MSQNWNVTLYGEHASFVPEYGHEVLELLQAKKDERILDLGCGDGSLTRYIKQLGANVHGVDSSQSMIDAAVSKGLSAEIMSGEQLTFNNEFDAVFSNAAIHWMRDAKAVVTAVYQSLKPGGRFVAEFGGAGNVSALIRGMETVFTHHPEFGEFNNPWFFPSVDIYKQLLEASGFDVSYIELIPRPTPLESGVKEWLKVFTNGITTNLDDNQKELFLSQVEKAVESDLLIDDQWIADYVRLRFVAYKAP